MTTCVCKTDGVLDKIKELSSRTPATKWELINILGEIQKELGTILTDTMKIACPIHTSYPPKEPRSPQDYLNHINDTLKSQGLGDFYKPDDPRLKEIADKAAEYSKNHPDGPLGKPTDTADLCCLGLYDSILFLDDSGSMKEENRIQSLKTIMDRVVKITTLIDLDGIQMRWINYPNDSGFNNIFEPSEVVSIFNMVKFDGATPLGTKLLEKVVNPMIIAKAANKTLTRPVIVSIITDGEPNTESPDQLQKTIKLCKDALVQHGFKENHVLFQISQIGNSPNAEKFLNDLRNDRNIRRLLYLTSGKLDAQLALYHENENALQRWLLDTMLAVTRPGATGP